MVGEKAPIDTSVGVWRGKERGRKGGRRGAHVCMYAVHVYTIPPPPNVYSHAYMYTYLYVCIIRVGRLSM